MPKPCNAKKSITQHCVLKPIWLALLGLICMMQCFSLVAAQTKSLDALNPQLRTAYKQSTKHYPAASKRTHQYQVRLNKNLTQVDVKICFDGEPTEYLLVDYKKANKKLTQFPRSDKGHIEFQGRYWKTANLGSNACIEYQSDISDHLYQAKAKQTPTNFSSNHQKAELDFKNIISFQTENTWLWLPESLSADETVHIFFSLPLSYQVSAPWRQLEQHEKLKQQSKKVAFEIGQSSHDWGFTLMLGEFELENIQINDNQSVNLAIFPQVQQKQKLKQWLLDSIQGLNGYLGTAAFTDLQIILLENKRFKTGPVPWGDVKRGGGLAIRFVVNSARPIKDFYQDWTATHELSHLLIPSIENHDIWLSEGLASYLQYFLMVEIEQLSHLQAWQKLYQGFIRGQTASKNLAGHSLEYLIKNKKIGARYDRIMRAYWTGAAYYFLADYQLLKRSQGKIGLRQVLLKFNRCCLVNDYEWSGQSFVKKLDQLSESTVFSQLFFEVSNSKSFPKFEAEFKALGIKIEQQSVNLLNHKQTPLANLRQQMIQKSGKN
jgi:hypothetical protein